MVEANGGPARRLTSGRADSAVPSWSHDGKWIYFYSNPGGRLQIWRTRVQGGPPEQVTRAGGYTAFESTDGTTLYYTKSDNGDDGLFAMPLTGGEEKQVVQGPISARGFAIFPDGVYYLTVQGRNADIRAHDFASSEIRFHEFASGRNRIVAKIEGQLSRGFTVSPDRKTFLFSKTTTVSDLMMIEHFQ
jgi:Tol biopolymer transport system component